MGEAEAVLARLAELGLTLAVAEGDTGGLLVEALTAVPGSSRVVLGGVVAYHDSLKTDLLLVDPELLRQHGAVSAVVAEWMARGARETTGASVGLATTGIAGPGGATATKPVGLAYVAMATASGTLSREYCWSGDRDHNRAASVRAALALALETID